MSQIEAVAISCVIEAFVAGWAVSVLRWGRPLRAVVLAIVGTLATHWAVWWFVLHGAASLDYGTVVVIAEAPAVLAEASVYALALPVSPARALALSLAANGASFAAGLLLAA